MSELDRLRELLDEVGVSYLNHRGDITVGYYTNDLHSVIEAMDHSLQVTGLTAEQAMRALGHSSSCTNSERTETCREVYLLMATDIGDGREEVLGVYATEEAATAAINENQFEYAFHHVRKWEVDA